jgi:hypothetical protein
VKRKLALVAGLPLVLASGMLALEPASVSADVFDPPYADIFGSRWNDLDTTDAARDFVANFSNGYTKFTDLKGTATMAMGTFYAQSDAIWVAFGHGGGGFMAFCNPPEGASCTTVVKSNYNCGANDGVCMSSYGLALHRIRLMVFAGCHTARYPGGAGRNLGGQAINVIDGNAVDSALAFDGLIYFGGSFRPDHYWATSFAYRLTVGDTISAAAQIAAQNVAFWNPLGNAQGWDTQVAYNGNKKVMPPAYGN